MWDWSCPDKRKGRIRGELEWEKERRKMMKELERQEKMKKLGEKDNDIYWFAYISREILLGPYETRGQLMEAILDKAPPLSHERSVRVDGSLNREYRAYTADVFTSRRVQPVDFMKKSFTEKELLHFLKTRLTSAEMEEIKGSHLTSLREMLGCALTKWKNRHNLLQEERLYDSSPEKRVTITIEESR